MPLSHQECVSIVSAHLTTDEAAEAVAYTAEEIVPQGTRLKFPGVSLDKPWKGLLVFVDRHPTANWTHECRYLLVNCDTGDIHSIEAKLPPFRPNSEIRWRLMYKAPSVPTSVLPITQ